MSLSHSGTHLVAGVPHYDPDAQRVSGGYLAVPVLAGEAPAHTRPGHVRHDAVQPVQAVREVDDDVPVGDVLLEGSQHDQAVPVAGPLRLLDDALIASTRRQDW